ADAGVAIGRMQPRIDLTVITEVRQSHDDAVNDEQSLKVVADTGERRADRRGERVAAHRAQRLLEGSERLVVERHGPRAAQARGEGVVHRLERVVPVAVAVGDEPRTRNYAPRDQGERAVDVGDDRAALRLRVTFGMEERQL